MTTARCCAATAPRAGSLRAPRTAAAISGPEAPRRRQRAPPRYPAGPSCRCLRVKRADTDPVAAEKPLPRRAARGSWTARTRPPPALGLPVPDRAIAAAFALSARGEQPHLTGRRDRGQGEGDGVGGGLGAPCTPITMRSVSRAAGVLGEQRGHVRVGADADGYRMLALPPSFSGRAAPRSSAAYAAAAASASHTRRPKRAWRAPAPDGAAPSRAEPRGPRALRSGSPRAGTARRPTTVEPGPVDRVPRGGRTERGKLGRCRSGRP